jgi:hypothetical protein
MSVVINGLAILACEKFQIRALRAFQRDIAPLKDLRAIKIHLIGLDNHSNIWLIQINNKDARYFFYTLKGGSCVVLDAHATREGRLVWEINVDSFYYVRERQANEPDFAALRQKVKAVRDYKSEGGDFITVQNWGHMPFKNGRIPDKGIPLSLLMMFNNARNKAIEGGIYRNMVEYPNTFKRYALYAHAQKFNTRTGTRAEIYDRLKNAMGRVDATRANNAIIPKGLTPDALAELLYGWRKASKLKSATQDLMLRELLTHEKNEFNKIYQRSVIVISLE